MFQRTTAIALLAGAIALVPAAAYAYPAPSPEPDVTDLVCSATTVVAGESFTCTVMSELGQSAQLQVTSGTIDASIAGTVTSAAKSINAGASQFTVGTPEGSGGTLTVTGYVDQAAVGSAQVAVTSSGVLPDEVTEPTAEPEPVVPVSAEGGGLAATGFGDGLMAASAGLLLVAGAATVVFAGRRVSSRDQ